MITQGKPNENELCKGNIKCETGKYYLLLLNNPSHHTHKNAVDLGSLLKNSTFFLLYQDGNRWSVGRTHPNGIGTPLTTVLYKRWVAEESYSKQPPVYRLLRQARVTDFTAVHCFKLRKQQQKLFSHKPSDSNLLTENTFHNLQNIKVTIAFLQEMTSLFSKFIRELTPNTHSNVIYV